MENNRINYWCWQVVIPVLLAALTLILRLQNIDTLSITQDESTMIRYVREGVLERGYPFLWRGGVEFLTATYELVPYPIALSVFFLEFSEFSVRLPAVFFATGTTLLIHYFANYLFDFRVALLSAVLFAILPWAIYWGTNCFYPSQVQFFMLLTTIFVHRLFFNPQLNNTGYYLICLYFLLSYFSWEVSGIFLPVFLIIGLLLRKGKLTWLTNLHAWFAACIIILVVVSQLTYRTLLRAPFEKLGSSLADISLSKLAFTQTNFDPFFYVDLFANSEAHLLIIVFLLTGLFFLNSNWNMRFLYLLVLGCQIFLTTFLGLYALRYSYLLLPYIIIANAASTFLFVDWLSRDLKSDSLVTVRMFRWLNIALLSFLQVAIASSHGLHVMELFPKVDQTSLEFRHNHRGSSFRPIAHVLQQQYRPGDIVIVQAPSPLTLYTDIIGDYFLQSFTFSSVFFNQQDSPYYMDKWVGNPVLRNKAELEDILYQHARVWFVSVPHGRSLKRLNQDIQELITNKMRLVSESILGKLYLWENY